MKINDSTYKYKNYTLRILNDIISLTYTEKTITKEWNYLSKTNFLEFKKYQDNILTNSFYFNNNEIICNIENCDKNNDEINEFNKALKTFYQ